MIRMGIIFTTISFVVLSVVWTVYSVPLPGEGGWDSRIFREREGSAAPLVSMALGAVNTFLDFYLVAVSLSSMSGLKLSLSKKIGVSAVFATGLLYVWTFLSDLFRTECLFMHLTYRACAFSILSLVYRYRICHAFAMTREPDRWWLGAAFSGAS